jgi:hypothetical protein
MQIVEMSSSSGIVTLQFRLGRPALSYYEAQIFAHDSDDEINGENDTFVQIAQKQPFLRCKASMLDSVAQKTAATIGVISSANAVLRTRSVQLAVRAVNLRCPLFVPLTSR